MYRTVAIIGGGPAGLMAAEVLASRGARVTIYDAMPSLGRKFLMAGKSGLNLTKDAPLAALMPFYAHAQMPLAPILEAWDSASVQDWARGLGQELFTGSTARVFPSVMKASPLLRAWLARLDRAGARRLTRWRWMGWDASGALCFDTPTGPKSVTADAAILALGGASWPRLGSDGKWTEFLSQRGVEISPFAGSNVGLNVIWSPYMAAFYGAPIKAVAWHCAGVVSRGEAVVSKVGLEGGGLYPLSAVLRSGAPLFLDLCPDLSLDAVAERLSAQLSSPRGKASLSTVLRKALSMPPVKIALLQEWRRPLPREGGTLAKLIKALPVRHDGPQSLDKAISTSGGVMWKALDEGLMLHAIPGTFCAGEMIDWEAPTGGYLLTACFATGRWAGHAASRYLGLERSA